MNNTIVDILFPIAKMGGFENALNITSDYLVSHGCKVRYIQFINSGFSWASKKVYFTCLNMNRTINTAEGSEEYSKFLKVNGSPDIIFVAGMPDFISIAKASLSLQNIHNCPVVAWPHNDISFYDPDINNSQYAFSNADIFFAISNRVASDLETICPDKLIYRINDSLDTSKTIYSEKRNTRKLAFVGRLSKIKNVDLILNAIKLSVSGAELVLVGTGEEESSLKELCVELGISDKVHFAGWSDSPWDITKDCKALIIASESEGSSLVATEALYCGMPVISTPVGSLPDLIIPGLNGYLYDPTSPSELAAVIDKVITGDFSDELAKICKKSVEDYLPETALWDFLCKTLASSRLVGLPQRNWKDKSRYLVKYKLSILISDMFADENELDKILHNLEKQTIETKYTEVILVRQSNNPLIEALFDSYEQRHSDNVILVKVSGISSSEELYDIAIEYISGDAVIQINDHLEIENELTLQDKYIEFLFS